MTKKRKAHVETAWMIKYIGSTTWFGRDRFSDEENAFEHLRLSGLGGKPVKVRITEIIAPKARGK